MPINWTDIEPAPLAQLESEAELLRLVHFWRTEAERLAEQYARLADHKRRIYLAKKGRASR